MIDRDAITRFRYWSNGTVVLSLAPRALVASAAKAAWALRGISNASESLRKNANFSGLLEDRERKVSKAKVPRKELLFRSKVGWKCRWDM